MTAIIHPMRTIYNDVAYGINVKYLLHFIWLDDKKTIVPLYGGDERFTEYKKWVFSKEVLENKIALEEHFKKLKENKVVEYKELKIIEFQKGCFERYELNKMKVIEAKHYNVFRYLFLGRLYTYLENKRVKKINLERQSKNEKTI